VDDAARVTLTMPAQPRFLRLARLAVADAGTRAGFTVEDVEDLRLAIDELCGPLMVGDGDITLTLISLDGRVEIEGTGAEPPEPPAYPDIAEAIIDAVVEDHSIVNSNGTRTFSATKQMTPG
jgi:serine/threonine-protein kinase RsbW